MSFFSVLLALLIEQLRPLPQRALAHEAVLGWTRWIGRNFDAGRSHHAWIVWGLGVALPTLLSAVVALLLAPFSLLLALAWNVLVLYLCMGFRQFSHHYTRIRDAIDRGDEEAARSALAEWRGIELIDLPRSELLRQVIEHALIAAHRHVFGVFFCFVVFAILGLGPAGAVLYRLAEFQTRYWSHKQNLSGVPANARLLEVAQAMFAGLDHVPARLTAFGFAVVGNFEEAVACWRRDALLWADRNEGTVLAAAAGAVGLRLGAASGAWTPGPEAGPGTPGQSPEPGHLGSVVGLVWRSVLLWMLLLALLSLANLIG
ncbi:CobD/CbiB family protein [Piscinibacter sp. Jin2]|uniref:Cobalamin biosynthesis protein CobD n=1 Tax=Aquariibacter lacus TaxID=2801332 RepID=A0A9X1BNA5_9BURK|nr:CobD/CbiB family protein [Piscinibacter lacus]MBL0719550.1 CobD/CbiB family protein [Piscinibacter lacus]